MSDGQRKNLGRRPGRILNDESQHDPVVPPTGQLLGFAGDQRIVVHSGSKDCQAPLATERVVHRQQNVARGHEFFHQHLAQNETETVRTPNGIAEETMVSAVVPVANTSTSHDQRGDKSPLRRECPPSHQFRECAKAWSSKNALKVE